MRVGLSAYLLHSGADYRAAGVSTYTFHLLEALPRVRPDLEFVSFQGPLSPDIPSILSVRAPLPTHRPALRIAWEQAVLPRLVNRLGIDVLHGTVNVIPRLSPVPAVVTVHDLAFVRHPERFPRAKAAYLRAAVVESARRARIVITDSENTRADLLEIARLDERRVKTVYPGVDGRFQPLPDDAVRRFRREQRIERRVILYVGTLEPRKNVDVLIRAFAHLPPEIRREYRLALVGAPGWGTEALHDLVPQLGLQDDVRFVGFVPERDLPLWYNVADIFVYPSTYEGFGLPLLEAMACGVPTVTSDSSSLRELAAGASLTVAPGSEEALLEAMARALHDPRLRRELAEAGLARARGFSWEETARQTATVYDDVALERVA